MCLGSLRCAECRSWLTETWPHSLQTINSGFVSMALIFLFRLSSWFYCKLPATEVDLSQEHLFINFWDCEFLGILNTDVSASSGFTDDWSCRVWSPHTGGGMRKVSRALQVMQAMQFLGSAVGDYISFSNIKKSIAYVWLLCNKNKISRGINVISYHKCLLDTYISRMLLDLCRRSNMPYQHQIY